MKVDGELGEVWNMLFCYECLGFVRFRDIIFVMFFEVVKIFFLGIGCLFVCFGRDFYRVFDI